MKARSNGGADLNARDSSSDGTSENHIPQSRDDASKRLATRQAVNDFISKLPSVNARGSNVQQEARSPSDNPIDVVERDEDYMTTVPFNPKDAINSDDINMVELGPGHFQTRNFLSDLAHDLLTDFIRRDVNPDLLLARTAVEKFANSIMRRNPDHEQQARDGLDELIRVLSSRRDIPKHLSREPSSQRETQARSDDDEALIKAFSRDLSRRLTTEEALKILSSRAMDDLD